MTLQTKLHRFKKQLTQAGAEQSDINAEKKEIHSIKDPSTKDGLWSKLQTSCLSFEEQYCVFREKKFKAQHKIGRYTTADLRTAVGRWNNRKEGHPLSSKGLTPEQLLFFDTETTGLGSGVGNTIFLLGVARLVENQIQVRQYFLPGPGNETALYHHFLNDVQEMGHLVTYNGKAFDWPQVKTRHTFVRERVPHLPAFGHFDLLHGSRRVWRHSLDSLRLSNVEKELLNIERTEDTPGYLAPMIYFEYLREKDPEILSGVFDHNERDVLTLIALYIHLTTIVLDISHSSLNTNEQYQIARWFEALGDVAEARKRYKRLIESTYSVQAKKALAMLYKRDKAYSQAVALWNAVLLESRDLTTYLELSKVYEHQYKDLHSAWHYAHEGYQHWKEKSRLVQQERTLQKERDALMKRLTRIERKIQKEKE